MCIAKSYPRLNANTAQTSFKIHNPIKHIVCMHTITLLIIFSSMFNGHHMLMNGHMIDIFFIHYGLFIHSATSAGMFWDYMFAKMESNCESVSI